MCVFVHLALPIGGRSDWTSETDISSVGCAETHTSSAWLLIAIRGSLVYLLVNNMSIARYDALAGRPPKAKVDVVRKESEPRPSDENGSLRFIND